MNKEETALNVHFTARDALYGRLVGLRARCTDLWKPICEFARWVEFEAGPLAVRKNQEEIRIDLDSDAQVQILRIGDIEDHAPLLRHQVLWQYLVSLGIRRLCLDPRLEMNQIRDLILFLKSREKSLRSRVKSPRNAVSARLLEGQPVHFACENVVLQGHVLSVTYSYCTLI